MFCCVLLYVHSSFAIILTGKRELVALLSLSSWCLVIDVWLVLAVPWACPQFVIVVFPDHTHLLFLSVFENFMENGAFAQWSKLSFFHNMFESMVFQGRQRAIIWSMGLKVF